MIERNVSRCYWPAKGNESKGGQDQSNLQSGGRDRRCDVDWLRTTSPNERWSDGYTANVSIGQGAVEATPLQMATVAAAVANGGQSWYPRLRQDAEPRLRAELQKEGIDAGQLEVIRRGMWKVVNEAGSTGKAAQVPGLTIAGKTGTAQVMRTNEKEQIGWFIGFAPYDHPELAICVMVQGAKSGGSVAAPSRDASSTNR